MTIDQLLFSFIDLVGGVFVWLTGLATSAWFDGPLTLVPWGAQWITLAVMVYLVRRSCAESPLSTDLDTPTLPSVYLNSATQFASLRDLRDYRSTTLNAVAFHGGDRRVRRFSYIHALWQCGLFDISTSQTKGGTLSRTFGAPSGANSDAFLADVIHVANAVAADVGDVTFGMLADACQFSSTLEYLLSSRSTHPCDDSMRHRFTLRRFLSTLCYRYEVADSVQQKEDERVLFSSMRPIPVSAFTIATFELMFDCDVPVPVSLQLLVDPRKPSSSLVTGIMPWGPDFST